MRSFGIAKPSLGACHRDLALRRSPRVAIVGDVRDGRRPPPCDPFGRGTSGGASILMEPADFEYGRQQYSSQDPSDWLVHASLIRWLEPGLGSGKT